MDHGFGGQLKGIEFKAHRQRQRSLRENVLAVGAFALDHVRVNIVGVGSCTAIEDDSGMIVGIDVPVSIVFPVVQRLGGLQRVLLVAGLLVAAPLQVLVGEFGVIVGERMHCVISR